MLARIDRPLFWCCLLLSLLYIWLPHYFLTNDGPAHLYNATVVHDFWVHHDSSFYRQFYSMPVQPNPNWLSHVVLASLLYIVPGLVAEKLLLTVYVLLFVFGARRLLLKIGGEVPVSMVFLFLFNHASAYGFYNFSLGIALYFWVVYLWITFLERPGFLKIVYFLTGLVFLFFAHLLLFAIGGFTCFALTLTHVLATWSGNRRVLKLLGSRIAMLAACLLPFLLMAGRFSERQGGLQLQLHHHFYRIIEFLQLKYLINLSPSEMLFSTIAGCTLVVLLIAAKVRALPGYKIQAYDGFWLVLAGATFVYLFFPDVVFGKEVMLSFRMQIIVGLLVVLALAARSPNHLWLKIGNVVMTVCFMVLTVIRINGMCAISDGERELMSVAPVIRPNTLVLPFNFVTVRDIPEKSWPFIHAAEYLGINKPLILLDNYEASTGFFPLRWTDHADPYRALIKGHGIEVAPPQATIREYELRSGHAVDYVLLWCYQPAFDTDIAYAPVAAELRQLYHQAFVSEGGRAILLERNK